MRTITKLRIGMLAVILLPSCAGMYHIHSLYEKTYRSEYRYEITIKTDSVLHNATSRFGSRLESSKSNFDPVMLCRIDDTRVASILC